MWKLISVVQQARALADASAPAVSVLAARPSRHRRHTGFGPRPVSMACLAFLEQVLKVPKAAGENGNVREGPLSLWDELQLQPSSANGGNVEQS